MKGLAGALLLLLLAIVPTATASAETLEPGDSAPDFSLEDPSGQEVTLSKVLGDGPTVLVFYRGHW